MKNTLFLLLVLPLLATGQSTVPRRGMLSVMAGYGLSLTFPQPTVTVLNGPYRLKAEEVENPECYDDAGRLVSCNGQNRQLSLGLLYRLANRSHTAGWMLSGNIFMQSQTFTLNYPANRSFRIPVACTPSIRRHLQSTGASVSLGRFWNLRGQDGMQWHARLGLMMAQGFSYLRGTTPTALPDARPVQYVSGNSGTIIEMYPEVARQNWLVTPEIGLTTNDFPVELAASLHLPVVTPTVFSERHSFVENNRITGQNRVDYRNAVFMLTARLGFNVTPRNRRTPRPQRKPDKIPEPNRPEPTLPVPDPHTHYPSPTRSRFDDVALRQPVRLLVHFDQSKSILLPESFTDLNQLIAWMQANPTTQIRLEGHTDLIGDEPENLDLSRRRVVAVKNYLSLRGVSSYRVETAYYGETRPLNRNCPPPNFCPENRRVEMVITNR